MPAFNFFDHPFDMVVENKLKPSSFQLKIIKLQSNVDLKQAYHENDSLTFYRSYGYGNYTNLENQAREINDFSFLQHINEAVQNKMKESAYR